MLAGLVALLVIVPLVEIYLLLQVGQLLGTLPTVVLLLGMSVLGSVLLKREGTRTWRAFRSATQAGRMPATQVADGALVIFGGALLLTPGFATDAVGLLCVLPGSRAVVRRLLTGLVARRLGLVGMAGTFAAGQFGAQRRSRADGRAGADGRTGAGGRRGSIRDGVVEGEVVDPPDDPPGHR